MLKQRILQPEVSDASEILHLKLWEGTVFDYSLNGNNGTVTGTTTSYTYPGLDLAGADEYIVVSDAVAFTPALIPFTISVWVNMDSAASFKIASKGVYNTNGEWDFYTDATQKIFIQFYDESVDNCRIGRKYNTALTSYVGSWIYLAATYSGGTTSVSCKIYLNGVQIDDTTEEQNQATFVAVENLNGDVYIGRSGGVYANGTFDDVRIYTTERTAVQIKDFYEQTRWRYSV